MDAPVVDLDDLVELARRRRLSTFAGAAHGTPSIVVRLDGEAPADLAALVGASELGTIPAVLIGLGELGHAAQGLVDVVVGEADAARLVEMVGRRPLASASLALLLRHGEARSVAAGLVAESSTYSTLQAGAEFGEWRRGHTAGAAPPSAAPAVVVERDGDVVHIVLNRAARHNAVDVALAEGLVGALTDALADAAGRIVLRGAGPSFCSGGDLGEFGTFPDPAWAHVIRLTRSAGQLIAQLADRIEVRLHGSCLGAGIELPAFAGRVVATPDARIGLPEIALGLVPGAGGTVSLPRRIGRHRTAWMALTGGRIDPVTALQWGLIDEIAAGPG